MININLKIIYPNIILFYLLKLSLITKIMNYSILSIWIQDWYYFTNPLDSNNFLMNEVYKITKFLFLSENDFISSKRKSKIYSYFLQ